jgi:hypothetical protein
MQRAADRQLAETRIAARVGTVALQPHDSPDLAALLDEARRAAPMIL